MNCYECVGFVAVLLLVLKSAYNIGHFAYTTFLGRLLGHGIDVRQCGPWAVVTGATDGIGKSYAHQLAKAGLNVVIVSRTPSKLQAVADEIRKANNGSIEIKTIAVDFTEGQSIYPKLKSELDALEIGILVNNVGMATGFSERFGDIKDDQSLHDIINCNMMSMVRMCHMVLPQMMKRQKGVIINIGSISGAFSTPMATIYGATKGFVDKFSRDLAAESKSLGITIQTVHPGFVVTNMSKLRKSTLSAPDPDTFVRAALATLGLELRTAGYWMHKVQLYWGEMVRFFIPGIMEQQSMKFMLAYRAKILARMAKEQQSKSETAKNK